MRDRQGESVVPLREFWSDYFYDLLRLSSPDPGAFDVAAHLNLTFGELTAHQIEQSRTFPIVIDCRRCSNNAGNRRASVCETHVGAARGTVEALLQVPLDASYEPGEHGRCQIRLRLAANPQGEQVVALAKRRDHIGVEMKSDGAWVWIWPEGIRVDAPREVGLVVEAARAFMSARQLAEKCELDERLVAGILDRCLQLGWLDLTWKW